MTQEEMAAEIYMRLAVQMQMQGYMGERSFVDGPPLDVVREDAKRIAFFFYDDWSPEE
jgi:hypothetical protein